MRDVQVDVENGPESCAEYWRIRQCTGRWRSACRWLCQPGIQFVYQTLRGPSSVVQGGVRPAPSTEDLRRFIDTAGSLSGPKIAIRLQKKLESPNWQECFRALCAIEMVILQGSSVSCGEIGVHFQVDHLLDICQKFQVLEERPANHPQLSEISPATVQDRAQRILNIFIEVDGHNDDDDTRNPVPSEDGPPHRWSHGRISWQPSRCAGSFG